MDVTTFLQSINAVPVSVDDLVEALHKLEELGGVRADWQRHLIAIATLHPDEPFKAQAIQCRLMAMVGILEAGELPGWGHQGQKEGQLNLSLAVWQAATTEPLQMPSPPPSFERAPFLDQVLALAPTNGSA